MTVEKLITHVKEDLENFAKDPTEFDKMDGNAAIKELLCQCLKANAFLLGTALDQMKINKLMQMKKDL